jgi:hypothetical protein
VSGTAHCDARDIASCARVVPAVQSAARVSRVITVAFVASMTACSHAPAHAIPDSSAETADAPAGDAADDASPDASSLWYGWDPTSWDEPPALGEYPDATMTGIPPDTALTVISGDYMTTSPGQHVDALDISGRLIVAHPGVTVKRSRIRRGIVRGGGYNGNNVDRSLRVWACEIGRMNASDVPSDKLTAVSVGFAQIKRSNIFGFLDGIHVTYSAPSDPTSTSLVEDNFFHDLSWMADSGQTQGTSHNDHIQIDGARNGKYLIHHNTFFCWSFNVHTATESCTASNGPHWLESTRSLRYEDGRQTSGMLFNYNAGTNPIHDVIVDDNRLIGHADFYVNVGQDAQGITITNNHFGEQFTAGKGYVSTNGNTTVQLSGNVHDLDGTPIPGE